MSSQPSAAAQLGYAYTTVVIANMSGNSGRIRFEHLEINPDAWLPGPGRQTLAAAGIASIALGRSRLRLKCRYYG
jgi:hypothetical protein